LWYGRTLQKLHRPEDGEIETGNDSMTAWSTADRLIDDLDSEAGDKYAESVRRCIRCDFDYKLSVLDDSVFINKVYERLVVVHYDYDILMKVIALRD
jgi:hypothetical protein